MSDEEVLTQDEIDSLVNHAEDDKEGSEHDPGQYNSDEVVSYDLSSQDRIVHCRLPTLEMINERFSRESRISWFNFLQQNVDINTQDIEIVKHNDYIQSLPAPCCLNLTKITPLRGTAIVMFDASLVYMLIDNIFGGEGKFETKLEGKEFTNTEISIVKKLVEQVYTDLKVAWEPVLSIECQHLSCEVNTMFANIAPPTDMLVVCAFKVDIHGREGAVQVVLPFSMLDPIKELLSSGVRGGRSQDVDDSWQSAIRNSLLDVDMTLRAKFADVNSTIRDIRALNVGDIIPIKLPEYSTVYIEEIPTFKAKYGVSDGNVSVKIYDRYKHN